MRDPTHKISERIADARWRLSEWSTRTIRPRLDRCTDSLSEWASSRRAYSSRRTMPEVIESLSSTLTASAHAAAGGLNHFSWYLDARAWWRQRTTKTRRRYVFFAALAITLVVYAVSRPTPIPSDGFTEEDRAMWAKLTREKNADVSGEPLSLPYPTGLGPTLP